MNNKVYQEIYDELAKYLPVGWEKIVVYLEYGNDAYTFSFYVLVKGKFIKCYNLPGVEEENLLKSYRRIDKVIPKIRNKEFGEWTNMTLVVTNQGDMTTDFDYTDLTEDSYRYKKEWKNRYLV